MPFNPPKEYSVDRTIARLKDFHDYSEDYVTRPPYQRKTVWSLKKKQALMDSILRRYYVPDLVLRNVRLTDEKTVSEVIDGQQRITTIQSFYRDEFPLPKSLKTFDPNLAGKRYSELAVDFRKYLDQLDIQVDLISGIETKDSPDHQLIATEIFWRLQQGESLNSMEKAHARLSSTARNFLVKYADDITFDFEAYVPVDNNPTKHDFFRIVNRSNDRMEHLAILARMLLIEKANGYAELKDTAIHGFIEETQTPDGIGNSIFDADPAAQEVLKNLNLCNRIFQIDPAVQAGGKAIELTREYFILSFYVLCRHLRRNYVIDDVIVQQLHNFVVEFHARWRKSDESDHDISHFSNNRQQGGRDLGERDMIMRQAFFEHTTKNGSDPLLKDTKRAFSEAQRIAIFRQGKGLCVDCVNEGKPELEAKVSWSSYQADHVFPWSKGGSTNVENGQVLCAYHNQSKGAR